MQGRTLPVRAPSMLGTVGRVRWTEAGSVGRVALLPPTRPSRRAAPAEPELGGHVAQHGRLWAHLLPVIASSSSMFHEPAIIFLYIL